MMAMELRHDDLPALLAGIVDFDGPVRAELSGVSVSGLTADSREVQAGDLYLACVADSRGESFIDEALARGAAAVLWHCENDVQALSILWRSGGAGNRVPVVAVPQLNTRVGIIADRFFGEPSKSLFVVGITGTNGKTSCSQFLAQAFGDKRCGVIGTLGHGFPGALTDTGHTTPDAVTCHRWLAHMRTQGADSAAIEVSSHALEQHRVDGVRFDCAVFTNLSREHLDYHGDMASYHLAKQKIFKMPELKYAVINSDDEAGRRMLTGIPDDIEIITYGLTADRLPPTVYGHELELHSDGLSMQVASPWGRGQVSAGLIGRFNASNVLATLAVLLIRGLDWEEAMARIGALHTVPGRMERFGGGDRPLVVVDYAHTPDALANALQAVAEHSRGELWCVFGCGGDRDRGKRPLMGEIAERLADHVIVSSDNPRSEDPDQIIADILSGMQRPAAASVEADRATAISAAIAGARPGDAVLVAGKGHENYQLIGDARIPFSDIELVKERIAE